MILKNYNWSFERCLPLNFCDDVIKYAKEQKFMSGLIGGKKNIGLNTDELDYKRKSEIVWLKEPWVHRHVTPFVSRANKNAGWNFEYHRHEPIQFTKYVDNGHYGWHSEMDDEPYNNINTDWSFGRIRKISITIPLVDGSEYEGGDFVIKNPFGDEIVIKEARKKGSVIVFPSFLLHKVTPVTAGTRYSLVMWTLGWPFN